MLFVIHDSLPACNTTGAGPYKPAQVSLQAGINGKNSGGKFQRGIDAHLTLSSR